MIINKHLLLLIFFLVLVLIPMRSMYVHGAEVDGGSGYSTSGNKKGQNESLKQSAINMMEAILNITNSEGVVNQPIDDENNNPSSSDSNIPINAQYSNYTSGPNSSNPYLTSGEYIMYRQGDYNYESKLNTSFILPDGKTSTNCVSTEEYSSIADIEYAGCGPTAVTNIIANLKNKSITPLSVIQNNYGSSKASHRYADCRGTTLDGAKDALTENGFSKFENIYFEGPTEINLAVPKLIPFLKQGAWILVGADFKLGGHFFVIIDIINPDLDHDGIGDGYEIIGLDSAYGNRNNIPINYNISNIELKIKSALVVYP